ncbi:MAG: TIGR04133 family radical SAM/SPASM protein [Bacteroidaceae bacterium]|nr:TIGR04133 family radical SAM/SPASM protein [Bacteroidaceae bacterium]
MPTISLRQRLALEISRLLRHRLQKEHPLRQLFWECTLRCNLHCRHCGSDCKEVSEVADMPAADFLRVIDESITPHVDPHVVTIIISGGEPLMRTDLELVGRELMKREYPWGMVTNGMLLTERRLRTLTYAGLHSVTVSVDGLEADHNWMRGHESSYSNAMNAVRLLARTEGIVWDIVTCVNARNIESLPLLYESLLEAGVRRWRLVGVFPMGRAREVPEFQLSAADYRRVMDFVIDVRSKGTMRVSYGCEGFLGEYEGKVRDGAYLCNAGLTTASILADGNISACTSIRSRFYQGNIYQDDFWEVWETRFQQFRDREWARKGSCADCRMWRYCEGNGMHLHDEDGRLMVCHLERTGQL